MTDDARPQCFLISPIGEEGSPVRRRADQVKKYIVQAALEPEYEVKRADDFPRPGFISN